jgi:hypothetical protein
VVIPIVIAFQWPASKVETQLEEKVYLKEEGKSPICRSAVILRCLSLADKGVNPPSLCGLNTENATIGCRLAPKVGWGVI